MLSSQVLSGLMGVCVADALGVPVEFTSREQRHQKPVTEMIGYGTYHQPPGTWSDDSSLTFCLAESLCSGFSLESIATLFCRWVEQGYWTPYGEVFDIGITTHAAIRNLQKGVPPLEAGSKSEQSNGNGSLMRILPLAFCYKTLSFTELIERVHQISAMTHGHLRSQMACGFYISMAVELLQGFELKVAYSQGIKKAENHYTQPAYQSELFYFERILLGNLEKLPVEEIQSSGYVIHTLEAALWCLLTTRSYAEAVLKAVNLGEDTDTTATVTGGLAGIYYGFEKIPSHWVAQIARKDDIFNLSDRLEAALLGNR
jgi:ADP-ribosyl-[dinitrogen reductase] hydrolase